MLYVICGILVLGLVSLVVHLHDGLGKIAVQLERIETQLRKLNKDHASPP